MAKALTSLPAPDFGPRWAVIVKKIEEGIFGIGAHDGAHRHAVVFNPYIHGSYEMAVTKLRLWVESLDKQGAA